MIHDVTVCTPTNMSDRHVQWGLFYRIYDFTHSNRPSQPSVCAREVFGQLRAIFLAGYLPYLTNMSFIIRRIREVGGIYNALRIGLKYVSVRFCLQTHDILYQYIP